MKDSYQHQRVAILGYGVEGKSSVSFFLQRGAKVVVHDVDASVVDTDEARADIQRGVEFVIGDKAFDSLKDYDVVVRSPSMPPTSPWLQPLPTDKITSQTKLFLESFASQTIGITGTKGKGTTATLLAHILKAAGKKVWLGGNIGTPLLNGFNQIEPDTIVVAELSSYQLWDVDQSPAKAILLMVVPEHIDVHGSIDSYVQSKGNLLRFQHPEDVAVVYADSPISLDLARNTPAQVYYVTSGDLGPGVMIRDQAIWRNKPGESAPLARLSDTPLRGEHNLQNLGAAVMMAILLGVEPTSIPQLLQGYQPLPHRLETVATIDGITYIDDSIATTPQTTVAAIKSFTEPLVVIVGGVIHQADWTELAHAIASSTIIKGVVALGAEADRIIEAMKQAEIHVPVEKVESLDQAVVQGQSLLDSGGVILLSPGAKSFDMFKNYQARGDAFKQIVRNIHAS